MKKKLLLSLLAVCGLMLGVFAQNKTVSGTVTGEDGAPIAGATVVVEGTSIGTTTDSAGHFTLTAPSDAQLNVSFIGYMDEAVAVAGRSTISIALKENTHAIDDVVVTGYGVQRKATFTGAASVVGEEAIAKKSDVNFVKALEGSVPGIQMNNSTSMPGVWGSIFVRGLGTMGAGSQPLYVVDGMPVNSDYDSMSSSSNNYIDPMSAINPNDIESVTVLKDAAATAIYGSRAANGVIVITTKKGQQGKFNLNVDIKQGITGVSNNNMQMANAAETVDFISGYMAPYFGIGKEQAYDWTVNYLGWDGLTDIDWFNAITRNGHFQDYNISASGQNGSTNYYASVGYTNTDGIVINSGLERFSGRLNLDTKFKMFSFGMNSSYSYTISNGFSQSTGGSMTNPVVGAFSNMLPTDPIYNEDGSYAGVEAYNPVAANDKHLGDLTRTWNQTFHINPYLQVDFGKGIYAKTALGANITDFREYDYWSAVYNLQGMDYNGLGQQYSSKNMVVTWTNILGWNYTFAKKHNVGLMLGQEMQRKEYQYDYFARYDFPFADQGMRDMSTAGSSMDSEYYKQDATLASYFVDAHYSYNDKYYVSASFRRDGSSVFGADNRWGNFWSVGARWRLSGENFLKGNQTITNAALHASYGTVGNQDIAWYAARGFYVAGYNYNQTPGMSPGTPANPGLTWEVSKKFDVGFDLSFINRVHFTFDYYRETTSDMLFDVPLSMVTGSTSTKQNIGSMRNTGIEFAINATLLQKKDFVWNFYANITANKNRIIKLSTDDPIEYTYQITEVGRPYYQFYMPEYAGVDRETGEPLWYLKAEGDETTSNLSQAAKRYVGSGEPKVLGGFGTSINWKGLDFNIDFNYRAGGKVYNSGAAYTGLGMSMMTPLKSMIGNTWTEDNKDAKYPEYVYGDPYRFMTGHSTAKMYSGSFLRISNLTLGYTLPHKLTKKALIDKLRIYFSVDNLYTVAASDFIGYNPETYASGIIAWQYPATRTFTFGASLTF